MVTDGHTGFTAAVTVVRDGTTTPIVYYLHCEDAAAAAAAAAFLDGARHNPPRRTHSVRPPTHCDQGTNNSLCRLVTILTFRAREYCVGGTILITIIEYIHDDHHFHTRMYGIQFSEYTPRR